MFWKSGLPQIWFLHLQVPTAFDIKKILQVLQYAYETEEGKWLKLIIIAHSKMKGFLIGW